LNKIKFRDHSAFEVFYINITENCYSNLENYYKLNPLPCNVVVASLIIEGVAVGVGETTAVVTTVVDAFCGTAVVLGIGVEAKQKKVNSLFKANNSYVTRTYQTPLTSRF
jgi:hypothetical protein